MKRWLSNLHQLIWISDRKVGRRQDELIQVVQKLSKQHYSQSDTEKKEKCVGEDSGRDRFEREEKINGGTEVCEGSQEFLHSAPGMM